MQIGAVMQTLHIPLTIHISFLVDPPDILSTCTQHKSTQHIMYIYIYIHIYNIII